MKRVEELSKEQAGELKHLIGEAFVTNELFHEFGDIESRRSAVMKYMAVYVDFALECGALYANDDMTGYIGLCHSREEPLWHRVKMLFRLLGNVPFQSLRRMMRQVKQNADGNKVYTKKPYMEVLMVCVKKEAQGQGRARELVEFAKRMAADRRVPLLFDTDMEEYAGIYQHYGCRLYDKKQADNGVTRYNLVWEPQEGAAAKDGMSET